MKDKFIKIYMKMAKNLAEIYQICYSRHIGTVIVDPKGNRVIGTGINGPPKGTPHCDSEEYLRNFFWPQLSEEDKISTIKNTILGSSFSEISHTPIALEAFIKKTKDCKVCPRRFVNAKSGEKLHLCSCEHSERNAIFNADQNLLGSYMFCWCGVPCQDCTKAIINSNIAKVFCLKQESDYSYGSRWLFKNSNTQLIELEEEKINSDSISFLDKELGLPEKAA